MKAISQINQWSSDNGYAFMYGNPAHINRMMHDTDFSSSTDNTAVYCYLITSADTIEAHDRVTVGVFFARLCDFDFNPTSLLSVQEDLMETGKKMLADIANGNIVGYEEPVRWQFGYDDFAENVAWVCARVTFIDLASDCTEREADDIYIHVDGLAMEYGNAVYEILGVGDVVDIGCDNAFIFEYEGKRYVMQIAVLKLNTPVVFSSREIQMPVELNVATIIDEHVIALFPSFAEYKGCYVVTAGINSYTQIPDGQHGSSVAEISNSGTGELYASCSFEY